MCIRDRSPTITCDTATHFSTTGGCHACGSCIYSPNWLGGSGYDNDDYHYCTITPLQDGWLDVATFDVETYFDYVTVDGVYYTGETGPQGVYVTSTSSMSFYADYINYYNEDGFSICMSSTFTSTQYALPTPEPTPLPVSYTHLTLPTILRV